MLKRAEFFLENSLPRGLGIGGIAGVFCINGFRQMREIICIGAVENLHIFIYPPTGEVDIYETGMSLIDKYGRSGEKRIAFFVGACCMNGIEYISQTEDIGDTEGGLRNGVRFGRFVQRSLVMIGDQRDERIVQMIPLSDISRKILVTVDDFAKGKRRINTGALEEFALFSCEAVRNRDNVFGSSIMRTAAIEFNIEVFFSLFIRAVILIGEKTDAMSSPLGVRQGIVEEEILERQAYFSDIVEKGGNLECSGRDTFFFEGGPQEMTDGMITLEFSVDNLVGAEAVMEGFFVKEFDKSKEFPMALRELSFDGLEFSEQLRVALKTLDLLVEDVRSGG